MKMSRKEKKRGGEKRSGQAEAHWSDCLSHYAAVRSLGFSRVEGVGGREADGRVGADCSQHCAVG